jgi:predicted nucleic acid-binding protein
LPIPVLGAGTIGRRGLIDTSVAIELNKGEPVRCGTELAASALTIAELTGGLNAASDALERWRRQRQLRQIEASIEALPFDFLCAKAYGLVYAAIERTGRKPRGGRAVDLMIAATALAHELPLYTLNPRDLRGLEDLIEIVDLCP